MNIMKHIGVLVFSLLAFTAHGQKYSVSTNMAGYLNFGTMTVEVSYAPHRHWSLTAGARYNPFTFHGNGRQMQNRQQSYSLGTRYWPWHIYSGWWIAAKLQYQEYSMGGIVSPETEEGDFRSRLLVRGEGIREVFVPGLRTDARQGDKGLYTS